MLMFNNTVEQFVFIWLVTKYIKQKRHTLTNLRIDIGLMIKLGTCLMQPITNTKRLSGYLNTTLTTVNGKSMFGFFKDKSQEGYGEVLR